ncbi:hypothetical protein WJX79_008989 [Trebouxia sp. C0005]
MTEVRRQDTALSLPCLAEQFILQPCICPSTQSRKAICRVCLEEDSIVNLTQPCSCSGSMQHIHTDCLQSWISEKRSKSCEICWQEYQGSYRLPSPGQSAQPSSVQLIFPLQRPGVIVRVDQSTRTINFDYPPVSARGLSWLVSVEAGVGRVLATFRSAESAAARAIKRDPQETAVHLPIML